MQNEKKKKIISMSRKKISQLGEEKILNIINFWHTVSKQVVN